MLKNTRSKILYYIAWSIKYQQEAGKKWYNVLRCLMEMKLNKTCSFCLESRIEACNGVVKTISWHAMKFDNFGSHYKLNDSGVGYVTLMKSRRKYCTNREPRSGSRCKSKFWSDFNKSHVTLSEIRAYKYEIWHCWDLVFQNLNVLVSSKCFGCNLKGFFY